MGDGGVIEGRPPSQERGQAIALAPGADNLHSRDASFDWSEGSDGSTAAYATRNKPPDRQGSGPHGLGGAIDTNLQVRHVK
jgi:hypothetical protein